MDKLRQFLTDFTSAVQAGKIYSAGHPRFKEFVDKSFQALQDIFQDQEELAVGVVEGEVACGKEVLFDLSQKLKPLLAYLEERGIERFWVHRALEKEEWQKFVDFLALPRGQATGDPHEYLVLQGIRNIRAGKIQVPSVQVGDALATRRMQFESALETLSRSMEIIFGEEDLDPVESRFLVLNLLEVFAGSHQELLMLSSARSKEHRVFHHLLNTAVLATFFSSRLGFSRDEVLDIGVAALYHDVGRVGGAGDGKAAAQGHSLGGACVLLRQKDALGLLPAVVAFEHHLRFDLRGCPGLSHPRPLHPATRLIFVCDVYDELYQKRAGREYFTPPRIYEIMARGKGTLFDPEYLDSFYRNMGVWPVGMRVSLSDGRAAVVRKANERDIFCPQVEVVDPPDRKEWIDLAELKDTITIRAPL